MVNFRNQTPTIGNMATGREHVTVVAAVVEVTITVSNKKSLHTHPTHTFPRRRLCVSLERNSRFAMGFTHWSGRGRKM